jgi:NADP-dependent 3-hydroxy acid dehydrogenase YdfG
MAKIAIVTGASRGIGRGIAKRLAADEFCSRRQLRRQQRRGSIYDMYPPGICSRDFCVNPRGEFEP